MKRRQRRHQIRKFSSIYRVFAVLIYFATAIPQGCSDSPKAPTPQPASPKPATQAIAPPQATPAVPAGKEEFEVKYTYTPGGRRDPFAPIIVRTEKKEKRTAASPLERYEVTEFKLTGIIWGGFGYNAVIEGPDGKGYFVRVGTVVGQNQGVIRKITKGSLVVEEKYKNYMGVTERKQITIMLRKSQEGLP